MRITKSFVVEYKRNSRTAPRSSTIRIPERSVEDPTPAAPKYVTEPYAAAAAIFEKLVEVSPSIAVPLVARRILPVIVVERVASPETETVPVASVANNPAAKIPRKISRPKAKTAIQPDLSKDLVGEIENASAPVASESLTLQARKLPSRRISRLKEAEANLPRGQRWKRRLPKFMR